MNNQNNLQEVPQVKSVEEQSDNLKLIVKLEQIRNSTYNLFGKKPLEFEKSFLKNLNANGIFLFHTDKPFKDLQSRIAELESDKKNALDLVASTSLSVVELLKENQKLKEYSNTVKSLELEAERDKYREALERLLKLNTDIDNYDLCAIDFAEQALNSKEVGNEG